MTRGIESKFPGGAYRASQGVEYTILAPSVLGRQLAGYTTSGLTAYWHEERGAKTLRVTTTDDCIGSIEPRR